MTYAIPVADLRHLYVDQQWSMEKCAAHFDCSRDAVRHHLQKAGITARPVGSPHRHTLVERMMGALRILRDDNAPLPTIIQLDRMIKGDAELALRRCEEAGLIATQKHGACREVTFLQEPGVLSLQRKQMTTPEHVVRRYRAVYEHLVALATQRQPLPVMEDLGTAHGCHATNALEWLQREGLITFQLRRNRGSEITITATGHVLWPPAPRGVMPQHSARRQALFAAICDMAARGDQLPPMKELQRQYRVEPMRALRDLQVAGLLTYEVKANIGTTVTITATGQVVQTRQNIARNHVKREAQRQRQYRNFNAEIFQPIPDHTIWGDLADDVRFLRKQGDAIEHVKRDAFSEGGRRREGAAKVNGVVIGLAELAARAERIRARLTRMQQPPCAAFAASY